MKRFLSAVLALGALAAPASAQPGAQKEDQARMQGTWVLIGGRLGGRDLSADEARAAEVTLSIRKDRISFTAKGVTSDSIARFTLDPAKTPKQIDAEDIEGQGKGTKNRGIYALEGDVLKLCLRDKTNGRPGSFESKDLDADDVYLILKRVLPASVGAASPALTQLVGYSVHPALSAAMMAISKK